MGNLMISNPDVKPFEGWQVQAREMGSDTIIGGSFDPSAAPDMAAKTISCIRDGANDTLTHTGKSCASGEGGSSSHEEESESMSG